MENIEVGKNIDRSYYLENGLMFLRLNEIMNYMPQFQVSNVKTYEFQDVYYETPEYFLKELNATVRVRKLPDKQILSIVCNELDVRREFQMDMEYGDKITDKDEYILFLEDKIQDIYTHSLDVDVIRVLHHLKPFLIMTTTRTAHEMKNNRDFLCEVDFDTTDFDAKRNRETRYIVEVKNKCYLSKENEENFEKLVKEFEKKVVMIPMGEKKLDNGMRVVNREW